MSFFECSVRVFRSGSCKYGYHMLEKTFSDLGGNQLGGGGGGGGLLNRKMRIINQTKCRAKCKFSRISSR